MSDSEKFSPRFYKHIDDPVKIIFFDIDDIAITFGTMYIQILVAFILGLQAGGKLYVFIAISIFAGVYYHKFKKNKPSGYIYQFLYRRGLYNYSPGAKKEKYTNRDKDMKIVPSFFIKELKGQ